MDSVCLFEQGCNRRPCVAFLCYGAIRIHFVIIQREAVTAATAFVRMEVAQVPYLGLPTSALLKSSSTFPH
jgi:hypothetical protein